MFTSIFMDNARLHHQSLQEFRPPIALPHDSNTISTAVTNHYHCPTACCRMEYNIVLFTMLYYNLVDAQLSQLGLQGENEKN